MTATGIPPAAAPAPTHGADVLALRDFAAGCAQATTELESCRTTLTRALDTLAWHGPDATGVRADWHQQHVPAMAQVITAIEAAGAHVLREALDQEHASSDSPGAIAPGGAPAAGTEAGAGTGRDRAEAKESRWARLRSTLLGAWLGFRAGGAVGAALGALGGPRALEAITGVADSRASRTFITEVPSTQPAGPPQDVADMMSRLGEAYQVPGGVIVETVTAPDGTRTAFVYAAGTQTWSLNPGSSTNDGSAAVASVMGRDNANRVAMLQALDAHGVDSGTPVVLVGHSQSAKTQLDMAADPYVLARYNIHSVVGAGAGGGQFDVPEDINVISLRNRLDPVTRLGGAPDNAITVRGTWIRGLHSVDSYTDLARDHGSAELEAWVQDLGLGTSDAVHRSTYSGQVAPAGPGGQ